MIFKRVDINAVDWAYLDSFPDRTIYQMRPWLDFLTATQRAEPVIASLEQDQRVVGFFTGSRVRRFGVPILGSPFPGSTTSYTGFNLLPGFSRAKALEGLIDFAFSDLACVHVEVMDRRLTPSEGISSGFDYSSYCSYEIDLTKTEDELFAAMDGSCRTSIRKAAKSGVTIEEAHDAAFANDYYAQLQDVFAKQRLAPTYPKQRVQALLENVLPTGNVLLLRARSPQRQCVATGIFLAAKDVCYYWGGASWRSHHNLRPNEILFWHAMRYWKERGITRFDFGGGGSYKEKYGGTPISVPWFRKSKYRFLSRGREQAKQLHKLAQRVMWAVHRALGKTTMTPVSPLSQKY